MKKMTRRVFAAVLAFAAASCGGGGDGITVTSNVVTVTVTPSSSNIAPGGTVQLTATPKDGQGNTLTGLTATWATDNGGIATVSGGLVTGVGVGSANISATVNGKSGSATVNVAAATFALSVTGSGTGSGTVTSNPAGISCAISSGAGTGTCSASFNSGASVTLTAAATGGGAFGGWGGACSGTGTCQVTMSQARTVTAAFTGTSTNACDPVTTTLPGAVNGSVSTTGCQAGGFPAAVYRFTGTGTNGLGLSVTSAFTSPSLEVMSDPPGNNVTWLGVNNSGAVNAEYLLPAGTYQLRVTSRTNAAGTFLLTGTSTSTNTQGCIIRSLVVGLTINNSLSTQDCQFGDGTYYDKFVIRSLKQCTISMTSAAFDSFLGIADAVSGSIFLTVDDFGVGQAETTMLSTCATSNGNPIMIIANTFDTSVPTGNYTLTVTITGGGSIVASPPALAQILAGHAPISDAPVSQPKGKGKKR